MTSYEAHKAKLKGDVFFKEIINRNNNRIIVYRFDIKLIEPVQAANWLPSADAADAFGFGTEEFLFR